MDITKNETKTVFLTIFEDKLDENKQKYQVINKNDGENQKKNYRIGYTINPYSPLAVRLMEIENLFRYTALAVGLKPSAMGCKARLRGLERIISSKTISRWLWNAKLACTGYTGLNS